MGFLFNFLNMNYYRISETTDLKIIGKYPQIEEVKCIGYDPFENPEFIDNVGYTKIDFSPHIPVGILNKGAKLTDFLSSPSIGYSNKLLISGRFKEVLMKFNDQNFQAFKSKIEIDCENEVDYWVINPINFSYSEIDFKKSQFSLMKNLFVLEEILKVESLDDFLKEKKRIEKKGFPYSFLIDKLVLNPKGNNHFKIINYVKGDIGYFVSESLKMGIEQYGLTGMRFDVS